jgi:hypothetical protein
MTRYSTRILLSFAVNLALAVILLGVLFFTGCHNLNEVTPIVTPILNQGKQPENRISDMEASSLVTPTRQSTDEYPPNNASNSTAILFLIDESGGVSGKCMEEGVVVVDRDGVRYQIVRFFLTLMGVYHREITGNRNLQIGIGQFARDYDSLLPLTPATALFQHSRWGDVNSLLSSSPPLTPTPDSATCYTNFPTALDAAKKELEQANVRDRILILITDGSFRSGQILPVGQNQTHPQVLRDATEEKLQELAKAGIKIYVFLIGQSQCRKCDDLCSLPASNWNRTVCEARDNDLNYWKGHWDSLIHVLDEKSPITALMQIEELRPFIPLPPFPRPDITSGWANPNGTVTITVHQYAAALSVWFFYVNSHPQAEPRIQQVKDVTASYYKTYGIDNVFRYCKSYPELPPPNSCDKVQWVWEVGRKQQVFYIVQEIIPPLNIEYQLPAEILLNAPDSQNPQVTIPVSVTGGTEQDFRLGNCYQMEISVIGENGKPLATTGGIPISPFREVSLLLPSELPQQKMRIQARLLLSADDRTLDSKLGEVLARYRPELIEVRKNLSGSNSPTNVQILIRYGNQDYVPNFRPHFYLLCEPLTTPAGKCFNPDKGNEIPSDHGPGTQPVEVYTLTIPYEKYWEPGCGCRGLRIVWDEFEAICNLNHDPVSCASPTPTPEPTPPDGPPPCTSALLLLSIPMACKWVCRFTLRPRSLQNIK